MRVPKTGPPLVTVIVLNYNGKAYIKRCLDSLFRNDYANFEVLVIDNNSADGSAEMAHQLFNTKARFTLIRNPKNLGFSAGNNIGFMRSSARYVIVLNNDTEVEKNFVKTLVNVAESDEQIGSVGCKIVQLDGRILYGPVYMSYGFIVHALDRRTYDRSIVNLANCGCATLFRKSLIDRIGGFDSYLWTDWEDHDLGYRTNIAGFKCVYTPETTVLHLGGGGYLGMSEERAIRIFRNKLLTYVKNYQAKNLLLRFSLILMLESLIKIKNGKSNHLFSGIAQFLRMVKPIVSERKEVQKNRSVSDNDIFTKCSLPERMSFWISLKLS